MMSRIENIFQNKIRPALIAYITAGYPDVDTTLRTVPLLAEKGCDIIEIGIPFSDPLADGVTIQNASYHALLNGVTTETSLSMASKIRQYTDVPLVFMTYYNPVYRYGITDFCRDCAGAGVDGLIIPDMPPEEGCDIETSAVSHGIDLIYLLAPTSNEARIKTAVAHSRGFIYLVSVTGVTGARAMISADVTSFIARVRAHTDMPCCVGFGISTPEQAVQIGTVADGVIIGSRIVQLMESDRSLENLSDFIGRVRQALNNVSD
jgi:tryptophan synthase alpha chain